jgi:TPR repeat protein
MFATAALFDGRVDVATGVYSAGADAHDLHCLNIMGAVAHARGDHAGAESYFRQAVELGDRAVSSLASVVAEQEGRSQEAEALLRQAADTGDEAAEYALGIHLAHQDECQQEAETILRRFADSDRSSALVELGVLIARQPGREAEAEELLRRAKPMSDVEILAAGWPMILNTDRRMAEQTAVMRRVWAAEGGENLDALYNLGWLIECREERQQEAEALYRRCVELGDPRAAYRLGSMLWRQPGHETEVEAAFRMAAANGIDSALYDLGALLGRRHIPGYGERAESEYREAAAAGSAEATLLLALLLADESGREDEAELYFRQAILSNDIGTEARYGLALLFLLLDSRDEELGTLIGDLNRLDSRRANLLRELRTMRDQAAAPVSPGAHSPSSVGTAPDAHSCLRSSPS